MAERQDQTRQEEHQTQDFNHRAYRWIERHPLPTLLIMGVGVVVLVIVYWAFRPQSAPTGAGFVYTVPTPGQQLTRTLWDWLGLLIVPLAVAAGAAFISFIQKRTELDIAEKARKEDREIAKQAREKDREIAKQARESEQQIANDRLRQATLESYYDRMTELLLEHGLRESAEYSEARSIARARTVAVVKSLDGERNRQLFAFLQTSGVIDKRKPIIDLRRVNFDGVALFRADLSHTNLSEANLRLANLRLANLRLADLRLANLRGADLRGANLHEANLGEADLGGADLSEGYLRQADLSRADLRQADLSRADLSRADLNGANLSGANLHEANLSYANLSETDLIGATLSEAALIRANLTGAYLISAVGWTTEQFDEVESLEGAIMPDGVRLQDEGNFDGPTYPEWKAQYLANQDIE